MAGSRISIPPSETDPNARAEAETDFERQISQAFERDAAAADAAKAPVAATDEDVTTTDANPPVAGEDNEPESDPDAGADGDDSGDVVTPDPGQDGEADDDDENADGEGDDDENGATAPSATAGTESIRIGERELSLEEAHEALSVLDWARSLDPEAIQGIAAFTSGQYVLVPADQVDKYQAGTSSRTPDTNPPAAGPNGQGAQTDPSAGDDDEYLDPRAAAEIARLNESVQQLTQAQIAEQNTQLQTQIDTGARAFAQANSLTDAELVDLQAKLARQQILPGIVHAAGGDIQTGVQRALEQVYWSDPIYRDRAVQAQVQAKIAAEQAQADTARAKKRKAGSLSGAGGSVSRIPAAPMTRQERDKAMAKEIADLMNGGQAS